MTAASKLFLPALALALTVFSVHHMLGASSDVARPNPPAPPPRASENTVAGTGLVEPAGESVRIGVHRSGVVSGISVAAGDSVRLGQQLLCVDDRLARTTLRVRESDVQLAKAELERLERLPRPSALAPLVSQLAAAEARLVQVADSSARTQVLVDKSAAPTADAVAAEQTLRVARSERDAARAELDLAEEGAWQPDLSIARARVAQASALLEQSRAELELHCVTAPFDAEVLGVAVRQGEYVNASSSNEGVTLGRIAPLQIRAEFDEVDIPRWRSTAATAVFHGQPQRTLELVFVRVEPMVIPKKAYSGASSERIDTRVLQVIYSVEGEDVGIHIGQQVDVFVPALAE
jgi:multidrug efflux pump subunit AcrA (membrane-fusion protein)